MVNFTLPSTTNEMISISTSQTFRSWIVIFHLRRPKAFLSLKLYDKLGLVLRMNVLFRGPRGIPVSFSNRYTYMKRHSGTFMVDTGIFFSNMNPPSLKWHSDPWPTVTSQPIRYSTYFMTLILSLTFTELRVVSMEHFPPEDAGV